MTRRLAAIMSLLVFVVCLATGLGADNPLATTLSRALAAMGVTFAVALVVGAMGQKMLDENLAARKKAQEAAAGAAGGAGENSEVPPAKNVAKDR